MKKALTIFFAAALSLMVSACVEDIQKENGAEEGALITETVTASVSEGGTKATISNAASDNFNWTVSTDKIAVHTTGSGYVTSTGASATAATASFTVTYSGERDAFAIYPSSIVASDAANYGQSGVSLDVTLPSEYTLEQVSGIMTPCPLIATNTPGSGWTFKQLCGLLRLTINNIPTGTSYLKVDFNGRKVSGTFSIAAGVTPGTSTIASIAGTKGTDDFIKITGISSETSVVVNIPLPTGAAYSDIVVSARNGSDAPLSVQLASLNYTAARARGKKLTAELSENISFVDANVKTICVASTTGWDTSGDGELSYTEAAAVTAIPCSVFGGNTTITSFDEFQYFINVTSIEASAFEGCSSLTSIEIPKNVTTISSYAFYQSALTSIFIPANVTNIVAWAFSGCSALIDISVSEDNPRYESRGGCNAIIDKIYNQLDVGCRTTIIPNDVELIRTAAFYECLGLTSITIPASIKWIGTGAFEGCSNLESIIMHPTTPPSQDYSFEGSTCPIYVSQECYEEYKTNWSTYQTRIQAVPVEAVDLGLSVKWGNRNQYAVNPSAFGRYFTFAEAISAYGSGEWRLPTKAEIQELLDNCTMTRETDGFRFTATNGNSIFMPTAGCYLSDTYYPPLPYGGASYWTSYQAGNQKSRLKWWDETHPEAGPMLEDGEFQNYKFSVRLVKP